MNLIDLIYLKIRLKKILIINVSCCIDDEKYEVRIFQIQKLRMFLFV